MATIHWTNGAGGSWTTAANWDLNQVPTSADDAVIDAAGTYTVTISTGAAANSLATTAGVTVEVQPTDSLTLTNGSGTGANAGTIQIDNSAAFDLGGTVTNSGQITLNSTGNITDLIIAGTATLQGSGSVVLSDVGTINTNRIYSNTSGSVLDNVDNTISGAGEIFSNNDLSLTNEAAGVVDATGTHALDIHDITVTNKGILEATNTGGLDLFSTTIDNTGNSSGGRIEAVGSGNDVYLNGADIIGGSLITSSGGLIETTGGSTLDGSNAGAPVVISTGSAVQIENGTRLSILGTITNKGTLNSNSTTTLTDLVPSGAVTLQGGGSVALSDVGMNGRNRIFSNTGGSVLDNVDNTISGAGEIFSNGDLSLTNETAGVIDATGTHGLEIDNITVTNRGILEATATGGLQLVNATVNNTGNSNGGRIEAVGSGNKVYLNGADIIGGSLITSSGGLIETTGGSALDGSNAGAPVVVTTGSTVQIDNGVGLSILGTITNNGTVSLSSTTTLTDLVPSGTVTLQGGGKVLLSDAGMNNRNRIYSNTNGSVLDNIDNTISGAGEIFSNGRLSLTNEKAGIIDATGTNGLEIDNITVANRGILEATATGGLHLFLAGIDNTGNNNGGRIKAVGAGHNVYLDGVGITGGTLSASGGGLIETTGNGALFDGSHAGAPVTITKGSTVEITNGTPLSLAGTITNSGTLNLNSTTTLTDLVPSGAVILQGGGTVVLSDAGTVNRNRIYSNTPGSLLDNVDNTISGAGEIFSNGGKLSLLNAAAGVIDANDSNALEIDNINFTNYGLLEAAGGTLLVLSNVYGGGEVEISGGGRAGFGATINANTSFAGAGTLEVTDPYGGTIAGMAAGDAVDLDFVPWPTVFVGSPPSVPNASTQWGPNPPNPPSYFLVYQANASNTGGTLFVEENEPYTVTPSGGSSYVQTTTITVASLNLTGNYTASDFAFGNDGHGGTVITTTLAAGQNFVWTAAGPASWQTSADWTPNGIPGAADNAALNANTTVTDNVTTTVHSLASASKAKLSITGGTFTISAGTGTGTNAGSVQVQTGGTLDLEGLFGQAATGQVSAAASGATVNLIGADIAGGTLTTIGGGVIETVTGIGSTLEGVTIATGSAVTVVDGSTLTLASTITNKGAIDVNGGADPTVLDILGAVTLSGGQVNLTDSAENFIQAAAPSATLASSAAISGAGQIGSGDGSLTLTDSKVIDATGTNPLVINTGATVTNTGTLEATGTSTLTIDDAVTNTGTVTAAAGGSIVDLNGGSVSGGTASIATGATLEATGGTRGSTLSGVTVTDKGTLLAIDATTFTLLNTVVNATGGVVEANDALVDNPSTILLDGATINGGTLETVADGVITTAAATTSTLNAVTIAASTTVGVVDNSALVLKGATTNHGAIALNSTGDATTLAIGSNATLKGSGQVALADVASGPQIVASGASVAKPFTLTNAGNTIAGAGSIGNGDRTLKLSNQAGGTIDADGNNGLTIDTGNAVTNAGLMEATAAGGLTIDDAITNNGRLEATGGTLQVDQNVTGTGSATVNAGGRLDFLGAFSQNVNFTGTTGELDLAHTLTTDSQRYARSISGIAPGASGDIIVLNDMGFVNGQTTAAYNTTTHVLAVTNGTQTADISILGTFSANSFVAVDDGSGKVEVHDPALV
jgi:hypothetical protein